MIVRFFPHSDMFSILLSTSSNRIFGAPHLIKWADPNLCRVSPITHHPGNYCPFNEIGKKTREILQMIFGLRSEKPLLVMIRPISPLQWGG